MHEIEFTTYELGMIRDALDVLSPDMPDDEKLRQRLIDEIDEEIYQNGVEV